MRHLITTFLLLFPLMLMSQTQTVKGVVKDKQSELPLVGATVEWIQPGSGKGAITDADGQFLLRDVAVGRQAFRISYVGYEPVQLPNVLITAGKEVALEIVLEESIAQLSEVVVTAEADKDKALNEMATVSSRQFTLEEVNRYSGGRGDVARLAGNFAGVATANDSRNDIVIRGNAPTGVLWRMEGMPIPNPNHFATLGTTGGPVSALNSNVLRNSDFMTSAFAAEYGNALAGVFDLGMRSGNKDRHEFMVQVAAFTGFEGMAEGPLNKEKGSSYLVAYRYSFVGLAQKVGLKFGTNATPNYQDLTFKIDLGKSKSGQWSIFGIAGTSNIDFLHDEVDEEDLWAEPDADSYSRSNFGILGVKNQVMLNSKSYLKTILGVSTSENKFHSDSYLDLNMETERSYENIVNENVERRITLSSYVNTKISAKWNTRAGILAEYQHYNLIWKNREVLPDLDGDGIPESYTFYDFTGGASTLQVFAQSAYKLSSTWAWNLGVHAQFYSLNEQPVLEPRTSLQWFPTKSSTLTLGYGLHHQTQPFNIVALSQQVAPGIFERTNEKLKFTRANHFVLGYDQKLGQSWRLKTEVYYQLLNKVPVDPFASAFSMLNTGADFIFPNDKLGLVNKGTGTNKGVELTLEKFFSKGYYALLTASLFDSKYKGSDGIERNTAFNNNYILNALTGKEFNLGFATLTFDTKVTYAGGRFVTPVDLVASQALGREVFKEQEAYSERQADYLRWDIKFGFQKNSTKRKFDQTFYFEIQNVTNHKNIFDTRYNVRTRSVNEVYQIGFFPNFMYKLTF